MPYKYVSNELMLETYGKINPLKKFFRELRHKKTGYITLGIPLIKDDWETG